MIDPNSCGALIKQIHDKLEKNANNSLRAHGITMVQCSALLMLYSAPEGQMTLKELEYLLHVAQSTAAGIVTRLEQKGLVLGQINPDDKRTKILRITPQGIACCQRAEQNMDQTEKTLLSGISAKERDTLLRLLQKIRDTL